MSAAYFEASRVFHPDRYFGKNLGSFRGRLERVFQRLAEAHDTLTETLARGRLTRRVALAAAAASARRASTPPRRTHARPERRARLARHPYLARRREPRGWSRKRRGPAEVRPGAGARAPAQGQVARREAWRRSAAAQLETEAQAERSQPSEPRRSWRPARPPASDHDAETAAHAYPVPPSSTRPGPTRRSRPRAGCCGPGTPRRGAAAGPAAR